MVKKRTIEARTKLQANKYPNHQACVAKEDDECEVDEDVGQRTTAQAAAPGYGQVNFQAPPQSQTLVKVWLLTQRF